MFVIELTYVAPLPAIDAAMKRHMAFVDRYYAAGVFLVSGRKVPRDGGVIIATARERAVLEAIAHEDPFVVEGLATVRIIEFRASQLADDMPRRLAPTTPARRR
jgi:uncharacterized protein YciI